MRYGHGVREYPSGVECFFKVIGHGPVVNAAGDTVACNVLPGGGCGDCTQCGRSANGGRREIYGLSYDAGRRLRRTLKSIDFGLHISRPRGVSWLTLTFDGDAPDTKGAKKSLKAFIMRLRRRWPGVAIFWKLEYQRRGAPHFHILIIWPHNGPKDLLTWAVGAWGDVAGAPCQSVHHRWVESWRDLASYIAGDLGKVRSYQTRAPIDKETGEIEPTGKMWGKWNLDRLMGPAREAGFGYEFYIDMRRRLTKFVFARMRSKWRRLGWKVRKWSRRRLTWAFVGDTQRFINSCRPPTGPPCESGLDSVALPDGSVRMWPFVTWAV